jgi:hypothetical protein
MARGLSSAVDQSFATAVSHTSLVVGIVMAVGTVVVFAVLPAQRRQSPRSVSNSLLLPRERSSSERSDIGN